MANILPAFTETHTTGQSVPATEWNTVFNRIHDNLLVDITAITTSSASGASSFGNSTDMARANHAHNILTNVTPIADVTITGSASYGTSTDVARSNHVHKLPEALIPSTKVKVGSLTRDMTAVSENVAYTGVGFLPKAIFVMGAMSGLNGDAIWGLSSGSANNYCLLKDQAGSAAPRWLSLSNLIYIVSGAGDARQTAVVSTLDADGFTLAWTKTGTPTAGTLNVIWLALG